MIADRRGAKGAIPEVKGRGLIDMKRPLTSCDTFTQAECSLEALMASLKPHAPQKRSPQAGPWERSFKSG